MTVWLQLRGPNDRGLSPKGCVAMSWNDPTYKGVPEDHDGWLGMRLDDLIVIDCDDEAAYQAWLSHVDLPVGHTWTRRTPHGYHLIYKRTFEAYGITARKLPTINIKMELKTGVGHQIVFRAPGYRDLFSKQVQLPFNPAWLPAEPARGDRGIAEWSEMPDGIGDSSMISFAGKFREWGMDRETIERCLTAINEITMTEDPMPPSSIRRLARQAAKYETAEHESTVVQCPSCGNDVEVL